MTTNLTSCGIKFIGYIPQPGIDTVEYNDYIRHIERMPKDEFMIQLHEGNFPPGLVVLPDKLLPGVIEGRGAAQVVSRIDFTKGIRI